MNNNTTESLQRPGQLALGDKIAHHLGDSLGKITLDNFPDGETWSASTKTCAAATSSSCSRPARRSTRT